MLNSALSKFLKALWVALTCQMNRRRVNDHFKNLINISIFLSFLRFFFDDFETLIYVFVKFESALGEE